MGVGGSLVGIAGAFAFGPLAAIPIFAVAASSLVINGMLLKDNYYQVPDFESELIKQKEKLKNISLVVESLNKETVVKNRNELLDSLNVSAHPFSSLAKEEMSLYKQLLIESKSEGHMIFEPDTYTRSKRDAFKMI